MKTHASLLAVLSLLFVGCGDDESKGGASGTGGLSGSGGDGGTGSGADGTGGAGTGAAATGGGGVGGSPVPQNHFLYVAHRDSDSIGIYEIEDDGALISLGEQPAGSPGPLAVTPDRRQLYAAVGQPQGVIAFDLDAATGSLSPIGTAELGILPVYISIDATSSWLLLASYGANTARTYALLPDGGVDPNAVDTESPGTNPHSILADPSNQWVFVPVTNSDVIAQYELDDATGILLPNDPASVDTGNTVGPRHMAFHPSKDILYVVNEHADSVTTYDFDTQSGLLTPLDTVSTLPMGANGDSNTCADIHVTPDGANLYASNRGHDSLATFALDATTGLPTAIGHAPTEATPREFEVTPDGKFVYSAGQASDTLAAYSIAADGTLVPLTVYDVGAAPSWVLAVSVDKP